MGDGRSLLHGPRARHKLAGPVTWPRLQNDSERVGGIGPGSQTHLCLIYLPVTEMNPLFGSPGLLDFISFMALRSPGTLVNLNPLPYIIAFSNIKGAV